jgi:S1-C subfamily serine protease
LIAFMASGRLYVIVATCPSSSYVTVSVTPTFVAAPADARNESSSGFAHLVLLVLLTAIAALFVVAAVGTRNPVSPVSVGNTVAGFDVAAITRATDPSVVDISALLASARGSVAGTGLVLSASGIVLTNNHVIAGTSEITAHVGGTGRRYFANVLGYDVTHDLAVLQLVGAAGLTPARLGHQAGARPGDEVVAIGNALGLDGTPTGQAGTISAFGRSVTATDASGRNGETLSGMIEFAAQIEPGDSGGPLVDARGEVIGLTTAATVGDGPLIATAPMGFAIPIDRAVATAREIERGQASATVHVGPRAVLGLTVKSVQSTPSVAGVAGAVVGLVAHSSPAYTAGIRADDVIVSVDRTSVGSLADLNVALDRRRPGDVVELGWTDADGHFRTGPVRLLAGPPL